MSPSETVVLVAWNGEACNLKWLWRLTQAPNSRYSLPANINFSLIHIVLSRSTRVACSTRQNPRLKRTSSVSSRNMPTMAPISAVHMIVLLMCKHRQISLSMVLLCHLLIAPCLSNRSIKKIQERYKMSSVRNSSQFVPPTPLGLSSPMNTTSCGSPGGKTNIQVHMGDQRLAQRSSSPISYVQQKASVIFSLQFFHWHSSSKLRNLQKITAMMIG